MHTTFCPHCTRQIHNKARLCLYCLESRQPSRLHIAPPSPRMPGLDSRLVATWAYPFQMIEKAGGADLPRWRLLSVFQLMVIFFNPWALLLGPAYFIHLGLWQRAMAMSVAWLLRPAVCLLLLDQALALLASPHRDLLLHWLAVRPLVWACVWICAALAFSGRVNRDFYRKLERDEETKNEARDSFNSCS